LKRGGAGRRREEKATGFPIAKAQCAGFEKIGLKGGRNWGFNENNERVRGREGLARGTLRQPLKNKKAVERRHAQEGGNWPSCSLSKTVRERRISCL